MDKLVLLVEVIDPISDCFGHRIGVDYRGKLVFLDHSGGANGARADWVAHEMRANREKRTGCLVALPDGRAENPARSRSPARIRQYKQMPTPERIRVGRRIAGDLITLVQSEATPEGKKEAIRARAFAPILIRMYILALTEKVRQIPIPDVQDRIDENGANATSFGSCPSSE